MTTMCRVWIATLMLSAATVAGAQDKPAPATTPAGSLVPLKIQIVLSRYQGEKKISSAPYVLWVISNEREGTRLRMGVDVPVMTGVQTNYRTVGTNIDCHASRAPDSGAFRVSLTITNSSVILRAADGRGSDPQVAAPSFGSFSANFTILLSDGQTAQYTSATDPVSGEVLKIDATLNVLK